MARNSGKRPNVWVASRMPGTMAVAGGKGRLSQPRLPPPARAVVLVGFCGILLCRAAPGEKRTSRSLALGLGVAGRAFGGPLNSGSWGTGLAGAGFRAGATDPHVVPQMPSEPRTTS